MSFDSLIDSLSQDTLASLAAFRPELCLCATIVVLLLLRIVRVTASIDSFYVALIGSAVGLWFAAPWQDLNSIHEVRQQPIFTGMLVYDALTIYFRVILLAFAVLFAVFTRISGIPDRETAPDFYTLSLGATLGMCLMASANHMVMVFLAVEMASVPSYALAGLLKGRRKSSEAALKYAVYGAGTAGVMLYGISLLAGVLGSVHIPTMAARLAEAMQATGGLGIDQLMVLALGGLMVMVGLAFKLSAVPFHFWCPDVFEGASAEVNAFLSVASKAAALALLVRVAMGFSYVGPSTAAHQQVAAFSVADEVAQFGGSNPSGGINAGPRTDTTLLNDIPTKMTMSPSEQVQSLAPARTFIVVLLSLISVITCTFGNLAAYGQNNIKRMLAYSTIAHAGYMIMPVAAAVALAGQDPDKAATAIGALTFYVGVYLFMNLGAFAVVAFLRNLLGTEEITDYAGLVRSSPVVVVCFATILISLVGLPPLAGFVGKFAIFSALVEARLWTLLVVAGLNTAISLYYYLRVVKIMTIDPEPENRVPVTFSFIPGTFIVAITLPVLLLGIWPNGLNEWAQAAARHLLS